MSSTILRMRAEPSNAVFWILDMERLQSTLSRCLRRLGVTAPSAPTTIGTTFTDFRCQSFFISLLRSWYLRILSSSLVFIRVSPGTAISTITAVASFFFTRTMSGRLASIYYYYYYAARGLWSTFERTLADVRIFNPNSESYLAQTLAQLYTQHENQKKRQYLNRVLQIEKGSFSPLVFTTTGGIAPEAIRFLKRVAEKISAKTREKYSQVMNNIRTRISFEIMRSVLVAVRGVRGNIRQAKADRIASIAFNLTPEARSYECP